MGFIRNQEELAGGLTNNKLWVFLSGIIIVLAVCTVPYNWDSMTYHLSRIANWAQQGSVAHYATHIIREIVSPVLAEFVNLHVYILPGKKDIFFPLLQCFSMLTNIWLIYEIAKKIGGRKLICLSCGFSFLYKPQCIWGGSDNPGRIIRDSLAVNFCLLLSGYDIIRIPI